MTRRVTERRKSDLEKALKHMHFDLHMIPLDLLCQRLQTDPEKGLSPNVVKRLLSRDGPNLVIVSTASGELKRFLRNVFDWFNSFLWIGSLLCFLTYGTESVSSSEPVLPDDLYLGCMLAMVVLISSSFSYYQEAKSANIFLTFRDLIPRSITVIRAGSKFSVSVQDLVVGDLIEVKAGDRMPADIRLIASNGLKCVNPLLTGDSEPFLRDWSSCNWNPFDSQNLLLFSTDCIEGTGRGLVVRTGDGVLLSNLLIHSHDKNAMKRSFNSLLLTEISFFFRIITSVSLAFGLLLSSISFAMGYSWLNAIIFFIALFVAQIPEGLFPTLTVVLTLAAKRMTSKNCLVKNLATVETLGLTSTIITDKTGSITQNRMIVSHLWINNSIIDSETFYRHSDGRREDLESPAWRALVRIGCLSTCAEFSACQAHLSPLKRKAIGSATEVAILRYMELLVGCVETFRILYPKVREIPFESSQRYSLTMSRSREGFWITMKGSPEDIVDKCSTILLMGKERELNASFKSYLKNVILEELTSYGERVIGFCDKLIPNEEEFNGKDMRFIGFISLMNPPHPSVPDAIQKCRNAGIKVILKTGDHPITAKAIARAVGIIAQQNETSDEIANRLSINIETIDENLPKAVVLTGEDIQEMRDQELRKWLQSDKDLVFARVSPEQKNRIVKCCRRQDSVLAVTGVGVEEPSISNSSDISVAMGLTGSGVQKQKADIILLDDNFSSIVVGIEEGRVIFDNLKKSICYTLSSKTPEICPFLLYCFIGIPLALGSITIFCVDLITDVIPAISLAYEQPESDIMKHKPRDPFKSHLVNRRLLALSYCQFGVFQLMAGFFSYLVIMSENGFFPSLLVGIRAKWDSRAVNDLTDSYGQQWTYKQRKSLEFTCQTAFFAAVVFTKWSTLICSKTRRVSLWTQGMKNAVLTFALFLELGLSVFLSYCPGLETAINLYPLKFFWWFTSMPFSLLMIITDEMRRYLVRRSTDSWFERETYY